MIDREHIVAITPTGAPVLGVNTGKPRLLPGMNMFPPDSPYDQSAIPIEPAPTYFDSPGYQAYLHSKCLLKKV